MVRYFYILLLPMLVFAQVHRTDTLTVNTWDSVGTNTVDAVKPDPLPTNGSGHISVMSAWNGGCYDSDNNRLVIALAGGHTDYSGNEVYFFDLETFVWSRAWGPSINDDIPTAEAPHESYDDGAPGSRHTYDGVEYIPAPYLGSGGVIVAGGALWRSGGGSDSSWTFDMLDSTWTRYDDIADGVGDSRVAYNSNDGKVYMMERTSFSSYDTSSNTWTEESVTGDELNWWHATSSCCIHTGDNDFYYMSDGELNRIDITAMVHYSDISTSGETSIESNDGCGFEYDPVLDRLVAWNGGTTIYSYNPDNTTWSTQACTGDVPGSVQSNGTFGRFRYMPYYNAYIAVNTTTSKVYLLKLTADNNVSSSGIVGGGLGQISGGSGVIK